MIAPRSLNEYTEQARKMDPLMCIWYTRRNLIEFIDRIVVEGRKHGISHFYFPYGKSYFLFRDVLHNLTLQGFTYGILKALFFPNRVLVKRFDLARKRGRIALIVDSIRKGREVSQLNRAFENEGIEVTKIFSYLTNSDTLAKLQSGKTLRGKIISHKIVPSSGYRQAYNIISVFLQSHIEPLFEDATYDTYSLSKRLEEQILTKLITDSVSRALLCNDIRFKEDDKLHMPIGYYAYSFDCEDVNVCQRNKDLFKTIPNIEKLDFEVFKLGLKVRVRERSCDFRIAAVCPLSCSFAQFVPDPLSQCKYSILRGGLCEILNFPKEKRADATREMCSMCIGNILSSHILKLVRDEIAKELKGKSIGFSYQKFDPPLLSP